MNDHIFEADEQNLKKEREIKYLESYNSYGNIIGSKEALSKRDRIKHSESK